MSNREKPDEPIDFREINKQRFAAERKEHAKIAESVEQFRIEQEAKAVEAEDAKLRKRTLIKAKAKAEVEVEKAREIQEIQTAGRIQWHGSEVDFVRWFVEWIEKARSNDQIVVNSKIEVFRMAAEHFYNQDKRKPFKPEQLQSSLDQYNLHHEGGPEVSKIKQKKQPV